MFRFQKWYFLLALLLFLVEVFIALFINDKIIRPYVGDFLVVILMYCFFKSFLRVPVLKVALAVLLFSYALEALQHFNLVDRLGLGSFKLARVVLGSSFEWMDLLAYTLGIIVVIVVERLRLSINQGRLGTTSSV
jgi:hypothetical protein